MRVFLLGAGASKSYDKSPTGQRMPIARDFFDTFDKLDLSANSWVLVGSLVNYIEQNLGAGSAYAYLRSGIDIEDLHSQIEVDRDTALRTAGLVAAMTPFKAFNELIFLFTAVINSIQNGPISCPHVALVDQLEANDVILTFNWDTLLDRALASRTSWRPDWGYGVTPRAVFRNGWEEPQAKGDASANLLIKLHGSTNWLTAHAVTDREGKIVSGQDLDPGSFGVFEFTDGPYACYRGRYMEGYQPYSYGYYPPNLDAPGRPTPEGYTIVRVAPKFPWTRQGTAPDEGLVSMPLIIPPVKNKSYEFFGGLFKGLWSRAEDALASADEIIIIGYSFPITDVQSDALFRRAFSRRSIIPKITIIDPSPTRIAERMNRDFSVPHDNLQVIAEYFSVDFDLNAILRRT